MVRKMTYVDSVLRQGYELLGVASSRFLLAKNIYRYERSGFPGRGSWRSGMKG